MLTQQAEVPFGYRLLAAICRLQFVVCGEEMTDCSSDTSDRTSGNPASTPRIECATAIQKITFNPM